MRTVSLAIPRIASAVASRLGYYLYLYVNPADHSVFYVGKRKNGRALAHFHADERKAIVRSIREIRETGNEPLVEILSSTVWPIPRMP